MGLLGWLHTILASIALIAGAFNLVRAKGTMSHRWGGRVFAVSMLGLCVVWLTMLGHFDPRDAMAFRASLPLFGLVAVGIFVSGELVVAGLIAMTFVLGAHRFAGDWLALAVAMSAGGALLFGGMRLRPSSAPGAVAATEAMP